MKRRTRQTMSRFCMRTIAFVVVFAMALSTWASLPVDVFAANNDFVIEDGVLTEYKGSGGDVVIPNSVTEIGDSAFRDCTSLKSIKMPDSVTVINYFAFDGCTSLTSVTLSKSLIEILDWSFEDCISLKSITIPESVTSIGESAFQNCKSLKSIYIPKSVKFIGPYAFSACTAMTSITMDVNNDSYCVKDGILYDKKVKTLIACPGARKGTVVVPDTVTDLWPGAFGGCAGLTSITLSKNLVYIHNAAFYECKGLKSITIPDSVKSIALWVFDECTDLTSVYIPISVKSIGEDAFSSCPNLKDIYYAGNKQQWNTIEIIEGDELYLNDSVQIHYNYGSELKKINRRMVDFLGATFKQLKEYKGKDYIVSDEGYEGGTPVYYDDDYFPLMFFMFEDYDDNNEGIPTPDNTIGYVWFINNGYAKIDVDSTFSSTDTYKKIKEKTGEEAEYDLEDDSYWLTYSKGNYTYRFVWDYAYPDNVDAPDSIWVCLNSKPINSGKLGSFNYKTEGWSFVNNSISFMDYDADSGDYFIPAERYIDVYGKAYYEVAKFHKLNQAGEDFDSNAETYYESMIPSSWGGNCFGMAISSALFDKNILKWSNYNNGKFSNVNGYYKELKTLNGKLYTTSGYGSEITKLIERYQIWQDSGEFDGVFNVLETEENYWTKTISNDKTRETYTHNPQGSYVRDAMKKIQESNTPLEIGIFWIRKNKEGDNEKVGHALLAYAWEKENWLKDEENGWYKVYVYDCNYPYANKILSDKASASNPLWEFYSSGECYIELNPEKNIWRYNTAGTTGDSAQSQIGCNQNGEMKNKTVKSKLNGQNQYFSRPDYFSILVPSSVPKGFNGTASYTTEDGHYSIEDGVISINYINSGVITIALPNGSPLCNVSNGNVIIFDDRVKDYPHIGYVESEDSSQMSLQGGHIVIPYEKVVIDYESGKDITVFGPDNVINIGVSGKAKITVDADQNILNVTSLSADNQLEMQVSDVHSSDKFESVYACGKLSKNGKAEISLNDNEKAKVVIDSNATDSFLHVLVSDDQHTSDKYVETVKSGKSKEIDVKKELGDLQGDLNNDGIVNAKDSAILAAAFGKRKGNSGYNEAADFNNDGIINAKDKAIISANFGKRK